MFSIAASLLLLLTMLAHSILGERELLRPLFQASWEIEGIPRIAAERILRFAWHLTSIAWTTLALSALGLNPLLSLALCGLCSGVLIFFMLRGHLAWPLFLASGLLSLLAADALPSIFLLSLCFITSMVSLALGLLHIYWALAKNPALIELAIPTHPDHSPTFSPPTLMTLAVALALFTLSFLSATPLFHLHSPLIPWLLAPAALLLALRAIGDGKYAGFTKTFRDSRFATLDDALYTPLVVLLCFGSAAALYLNL